jgi:type IV pilus assembly protein PilW
MSCRLWASKLRLQGPQANRGLTLVELLISLALGMVIIGILVVVYASGSVARHYAQAQSSMNEDAQMALQAISQELRKAGYNPQRTSAATPLVNNITTKDYLGACDTGFSTSPTYFGTPSCNTTGTNSAVAVAYEGDAYSGKISNSNSLLNCAGAGVAATASGGASFYSMQSVLSIAPGSNGLNALRCGGPGNPETLAENIEKMVLSFALTDPKNASSKQVAGYQSATSINTLTNSNFLDATSQTLTIPKRWSMVAAVRVCIVVVSEKVVLADMMGASTVNASYWDCDAADGTPPSSPTSTTDGRLRRAYRTTVILRNLGNGGVGYVNG